MKKFIIALLFALLLCSCGVAEPVPDEPAPENEISVPEEEKEPVPAVDETENSEDSSAFGSRLITSASNGYRLEELGISQKAENVIINKNGTLTFDLTLKKGGREITRNIRGYLLSDGHYGTVFEWGGYSFTANGHLAICGTEQLIIINPYDFFVVDIEFDFDGLAADDRNLWINGVIYDENSGNWIVSAAEAELNHHYENPVPWRIFVFDENGNFLSECPTEVGALHGGWADFATPSVAGKCTILNNKGKTYYSFGSRCYCVEDGKAYQGSSYSEPYNASDGSYSIYFYDCYYMDENSDGNYSSTGKPLGFYAVLREHDTVVDFLHTGDEYIASSDGWGEIENPIKVTHNGGRSFTMENIYLAKSMELDFDKETYSVSYNYTDEHLAEHIATSADGNYSLWQAGVDGGGEAYFYDVALKNNKTGKIFHLEPNGTNVGRFSYEGFLKNGDVYVFSSSGLRIYDPETVELIFDIDENFPMENRILYTFRRDPGDFSYIVVYSDCTDEDIHKGYAENTFVMPFTIKIGYLDKDGNLIKSFDSGVYERYDHFGLEAIEMRYSADELLLVTSGGKGFNGIQFTFDRKTETFSKPVPAE